MHSPIAATCSILSSCPPPRFHYSLRCRVRRAASRGRSAMHEIFSGVAVIPVLTIARAALSGADVTRATEAGARFLVSPGLTPELAGAGRAGDLPYFPSDTTTTE